MISLRAAVTAVTAGIAVLLGPATPMGTDAQDEPASGTIPAGIARRDITPDFPVRLAGYAARTAESNSAIHRIWAKALAIGGSDAEAPAVLVTVDNCGVCHDITEEVARRLAEKRGLPRPRFAVCSSHTHAAPCTTGFAPNLFAHDLPPEEVARIARYTAELTDAIEAVALEAIDSRVPATLAWGQGEVTFAANRRTPGGPVDHRLPVLRVAATDGRPLAVLASYACHCTTLGGGFNEVCGDWAGFAQEAIERGLAGTQGMIAIGCGADANPHPRSADRAEALELARRHGEALGAEAVRVTHGPLVPLRSVPDCRFRTITLPYQPHFTRSQLEERATANGIVGYHARRWLARLDGGQSPPAGLEYPVQAWIFGDDLAMVHLGGEVVVDFALRLRRELDGTRLWINAYANDVPCYIPSRRILEEGGYEAVDSLWYYDRPQQLAPEGEDLLVNAVRDLVPDGWRRDPDEAGAVERVPPPRDGREAARSIRTPHDLAIDLAVAEPLVVDPVAIDWGPDGRLWVAEMLDYPMGLDGRWKPGGRIRVLADTDGDGRYDQAEVFLDGLPFPTGLLCWGRGAFVCAAPDILFAEDTDDDGRADRVETWFTGFHTDNYQARVSGLQLGLDGWIHGANGLLGGTITQPVRGATAVELGGRDFRFHPLTRAFETVTGLSQQGRVRDDWGEWFGCDNGTLARHFPLDAAHLARNPAVVPPADGVDVAAGGDPRRLFPASPAIERYNDPQDANRVTGACGIGIYRDDALGAAFEGDVFTPEPVHNLVRRLDLEPAGITFRGGRAPGEEQAEFFASTDPWCRPVQARTGPDGALWIVDMYRFIIEHPRWIPASRLVGIDVRAGCDRGRLWRVHPPGAAAACVPEDLTGLALDDLVARLRTPNGTERDRVHAELLFRGADALASAADGLRALAADGSASAAARAQTVHLLASSGAHDMPVVFANLADDDARLRRTALRVLEPLLDGGSPGPELSGRLRELVDDPDPGVRFQLALALGAWRDSPEAAPLLARLLVAGLDDPWMRAAALTSATPHASALVEAFLALEPSRRGPGWSPALAVLVETAAASRDPSLIVHTASRVLDGGAAALGGSDAAMLDVMNALFRGIPADPSAAGVLPGDLTARARSLAEAVLADPEADPGPRAKAVDLASRCGLRLGERPALARRLLAAEAPVGLRRAALEALARDGADSTPTLLGEILPGRTPVQRREILRAWSTRPEWRPALVAAVADGHVAPRELGPDLATLLRGELDAGTVDPATAGRARRLLDQEAATTAWSDERIAARALAVDALAGDQSRGAERFDAACAICHRLHGRGTTLGPDLDVLLDRETDYWLRNIAAPNAAIEPRFLGSLVRLTDGRTLAGIIADETPSGFRLRIPGGSEAAVRRAEVETIEPLAASLMPAGLVEGWSDDDLADLLAFIRGAPGAFAVPEADVAARNRETFAGGDEEAGGRGVLYVFEATERLPYPSWLGELELALCRLDGTSPGLVWQSKPVPDAIDESATFTFRVPAAMGYRSQPEGSFRLHVQGHGDPDDAVDLGVALEDTAWSSRSGRVHLRYTVRQRNSEDSNGILEIEVPGSWLVRRQPLTFEVTGEERGSLRWFGVYRF